MSTIIDYQAAWKDYRRRRTILGVVFVGGLTLVWFVVSDLDLSDTARTSVACTWLLVAVLAGTYLSFFPCPRCGKTMRPGLFTKLAWGCSNCGLRIGEEPSTEGAEN